MSAVTREYGTPPFARRRWRQLRRRPRARTACDDSRGLVSKDASVHERSGKGGGGAELSSRQMGGSEGIPEIGAGSGATGGGAWPGDSRGRAR